MNPKIYAAIQAAEHLAEDGLCQGNVCVVCEARKTAIREGWAETLKIIESEKLCKKLGISLDGEFIISLDNGPGVR